MRIQTAPTDLQYPATMRLRIHSAAIILSTAFATLLACGDDIAENDATCDATQPFLVANLAADIGDYMRVIPVGEYVYINIYGFDLPPDQPGRIHEPDNVYSGLPLGGQTWVTGPCGESPVLIGGDEFSYLVPLFFGDGADPTFACSGGGGGSRIYRIDLTGATPPELLLEHWTCAIETARPVATHRESGIHELWHVPSYPDLGDAVLLAEDIQKDLGHDATHNYYIGDDQALHAVDIAANDEILQADVTTAIGGATGSWRWDERTGPTRLLWAAGEPEAVYLFRGETGDAVKLADSEATDWSEEETPEWAWGFNWSRTHILHQPTSGDEGTIRVFDLDGAPIPFPTGVHAYEPLFSWDGVLGTVEGPQGPRWVYAPFGAADPIPLDLAWEDPDIRLYAFGDDYLVYYDKGADRTMRVPHDGSPAVEIPDLEYPYSDDDAFSHHNEQLLHVDRRTGESTLLQGDIGAYGPNSEYRDGKYVTSGVFYTDISSRAHPGLWYAPIATYPGTAWR